MAESIMQSKKKPSGRKPDVSDEEKSDVIIGGLLDDLKGSAVQLQAPKSDDSSNDHEEEEDGGFFDLFNPGATKTETPPPPPEDQGGGWFDDIFSLDETATTQPTTDEPPAPPPSFETYDALNIQEDSFGPQTYEPEDRTEPIFRDAKGSTAHHIVPDSHLMKALHYQAHPIREKFRAEYAAYDAKRLAFQGLLLEEEGRDLHWDGNMLALRAAYVSQASLESAMLNILNNITANAMKIMDSIRRQIAALENQKTSLQAIIADQAAGPKLTAGLKDGGPALIDEQIGLLNPFLPLLDEQKRLKAAFLPSAGRISLDQAAKAGNIALFAEITEGDPPLTEDVRSKIPNKPLSFAGAYKSFMADLTASASLAGYANPLGLKLRDPGGQSFSIADFQAAYEALTAAPPNAPMPATGSAEMWDNLMNVFFEWQAGNIFLGPKGRIEPQGNDLDNLDKDAALVDSSRDFHLGTLTTIDSSLTASSAVIKETITKDEEITPQTTQALNDEAQSIRDQLHALAGVTKDNMPVPPSVDSDWVRPADATEHAFLRARIEGESAKRKAAYDDQHIQLDKKALPVRLFTSGWGEKDSNAIIDELMGPDFPPRLRTIMLRSAPPKRLEEIMLSPDFMPKALALRTLFLPAGAPESLAGAEIMHDIFMSLAPAAVAASWWVTNSDEQLGGVAWFLPPPVLTLLKPPAKANLWTLMASTQKVDEANKKKRLAAMPPSLAVPLAETRDAADEQNAAQAPKRAAYYKSLNPTALTSMLLGDETLRNDFFTLPQASLMEILDQSEEMQLGRLFLFLKGSPAFLETLRGALSEEQLENLNNFWGFTIAGLTQHPPEHQ